VSWFTKPVAAEVETVPRATPESLLAEVERDFRIAERAFIEYCRKISAHNAVHKDLRRVEIDGASCVLLNAASHDPELQQLEAAADRARRARNSLLEKRAQLLKDLGRVR